jgi:hypothetical protein
MIKILNHLQFPAVFDGLLINAIILTVLMQFHLDIVIYRLLLDVFEVVGRGIGRKSGVRGKR